MAYKSKEKLLELGTGKFSYCTVDPKKGTPCKKHFHAEQIALKGKEAERLRKLGKELIEMSGENYPVELTPEEVYETLGMKQPKTKTTEEANAWMEENIVEVINTNPVIVNDIWLTPDSSKGIKCKECGNDIQLVKLKNGLTTWHHPDHAELDTIGNVYFTDSSSPYSINHVSSSPEDWTEEDVELIKSNAEIGSDLGYMWQGPHILGFARVDAEGQSSQEYKASNHAISPADHCGKCGQQNTIVVKKQNGGIFRRFTYRETEECSNCGSSRVTNQY